MLVIVEGCRVPGRNPLGSSCATWVGCGLTVKLARTCGRICRAVRALGSGGLWFARVELVVEPPYRRWRAWARALVHGRSVLSLEHNMCAY